MPEAARQHEQMAEPKSAVAATADEIVLSPRVIDRLAFDEYVRLLRGEIDKAAGESELLARRAEAGAVILDQLERFMGDNGSAIEHAAEVLAGIDERMTASRDVLDEIERRSAGLSKASRDAEQAIEARAEAFQSRLRSIVDTAMDRFEETEDQLTARAASARRELLDRLEQMRSRGEDTLGRLDTRATELTGEAQGILLHTEARLDALRGPARELLGSIESRAAVLDARANEHIEQINTSASTAATMLADAQSNARQQDATLRETIAAAASAADRVRVGCAGILNEARQQIDKILTPFDEQAALIVEQGAAHLNDAATAALENIAPATADARDAEQRLNNAMEAVIQAERSPTLRDTLAQCAAAETTARAAAKSIADLEAQAATARSVLADAILEGADQIDALDARAEALRTAGAAEADRLEAVLADATGTSNTQVVDQLVDRLVDRVQERTRSEMRVELEMATAALATLSERVAALEASAAASPDAKPTRKTSAKPASKPASKRTTKKTSPKRASAHKTGPAKATAKKTSASKTRASQQADPKPPTPARSTATAEVKPQPDAEASSKKSA